MKLKEKIQILIEKIKPMLPKSNVVRATILGIIIFGVIVLFAWCKAPSRVDVPAAVVIETQAEAKHESATEKLADADQIAGQSAVVDSKRVESRKRLNESIEKSRSAETRRRGVEKEYEEIRKKPVSVVGTDLDARERRLLSDLRDIQQ